MTDGEKMIWAAMFVLRVNNDRDAGRPLHVDPIQWELDIAASAAEHASYAVEMAHTVEQRVKDGWGEGDVLQRLREVVA